MAVIPCCADLGKFRPDEAARAKVRGELGVGERDLVVVYSGSLGNWYLAGEMARFFAQVHARRPDARWLVLTPSDPAELAAHAARAGVPGDHLHFRRARPAEMPGLLAAGDMGLSFIQSCFSKTGSSPTKVAEYLASGLPVVLNADIGDQRDLAAERDCAVILGSYAGPELGVAAEQAIRLAARPRAERAAAAVLGATRHFSLDDLGVPRYEALYRALVAGPRRAGQGRVVGRGAARAPAGGDGSRMATSGSVA
jgi:glycosyltransferase involved in cell wall biosynthesis